MSKSATPAIESSRSISPNPAPAMKIGDTCQKVTRVPLKIEDRSMSKRATRVHWTVRTKLLSTGQAQVWRGTRTATASCDQCSFTKTHPARAESLRIPCNILFRCGSIKIFTKPSARAEVMIQWDPLACMAFVYVLPNVIQLQHWFAAQLMRTAQLLSWW